MVRKNHVVKFHLRKMSEAEASTQPVPYSSHLFPANRLWKLSTVWSSKYTSCSYHRTWLLACNYAVRKYKALGPPN